MDEQSMRVEMIDPRTVNPCEELNTRRHSSSEKYQELRESIRAKGVQQPIVVREAAQGDFLWDLIIGSRRLHAVLDLQLPLVPASIRNVSPEEAQELRIIENLHREDIHPLDEAAGFEDLKRRLNLSFKELAIKVAKPRSYVIVSLQLLKLTKKAQQLFLSGKLTHEHVKLIAPLPEKHQKALLAAIDFEYGESPRDVRAWIESNVYLALDAAPWAKDDAALYEKAGPCTLCPKRTGFEPALFPDVQQGDACTDRACFDKKMELYFKRLYAEAPDNNKPVKISTDSFYGGSKINGVLYPGDYQMLGRDAEPCESSRDGFVANGSYRRGQPFRVCIDPKCQVHNPRQSRTSLSDADKESRKKEREQKRLDLTYRASLMSSIAAALPDAPKTKELRLVAHFIVDHIHYDFQRRACDHFGLELPKKSQTKNYAGLLHKRVDQEKNLLAFIAWVIMSAAPLVGELENIADLYGIEPKKIRRIVEKEFAAQLKAKAEKREGKANGKSANGSRFQKPSGGSKSKAVKKPAQKEAQEA